MTVQRQSCHACGSQTLVNLLVRDSGAPLVVFVQCGGCGALVARCVVSEFYQHGQALESWLRSRGISASESAEEHLHWLEDAQRTAQDEFARVLEQLDEPPG